MLLVVNIDNLTPNHGPGNKDTNKTSGKEPICR
jgi:hypothetical protein